MTKIPLLGPITLVVLGFVLMSLFSGPASVVRDAVDGMWQAVARVHLPVDMDNTDMLGLLGDDRAR